MSFSLSNIRERLRSTLWFIPGICVVAALVLAEVALAIDRRVTYQDIAWAFGGGPESARQILSTIAGSMITLTALVFTITIVVLQLASSQFSPRVLRTFLRDRYSQFTLGVFIATFTYALAVLREIRAENGAETSFTAGISVTLSFALVLASLAIFVGYINHVTQAIRAVKIIDSVARETRALIDRTYPQDADHPPPWEPPADEPSRTVIWENAPGTLASVDTTSLVSFARNHDCVVALIPSVGDFVPRGAPILTIYGNMEVEDSSFTSRVSVGRERTMQQDVAFGFRQLVDIADRALSTGVNDPTTAVQCLDQIHDFLRTLATRPFPSGVHHDDDGNPRVLLPTATWDQYVSLGIDEIRQFGQGSIQVVRRLRALLEDVLSVAPEDRRPALERQLELLDAQVERSFPDRADRVLAREGDEQGMGS